MNETPQHGRPSATPVRLRSTETVPTASGERPYSACYAPSVQLYFQPDGDVRACCRNMTHPLGNVATDRLGEIWTGARRRLLQEHLARDDYSLGCRGCEWEVTVEGRESSYPRKFDTMASHLTDDAGTAAWPRFMEFNLSNVCNLQCIQCNGDLSSSIRIHREGRPALPKVYGDEFFDDIRPFLPHLEKAQFAGGEPFMAAENYRLWDLIAEVAPHIEGTVVTNATQWNRRVEQVLERFPMNLCFSIDGVTEATYESVRLGANFDEVIANVDRFCAYARRAGTTTSLNHCLMAQNFQEFGDLLLFAEERGIFVDVSVVHYPEHCSIARLPRADIAAIAEHLEAQSDRVLAQLELNAGVWRQEVARIRHWADGHDPQVDHDELWSASSTRIAGLPRDGRGASDDTEATAALRAVASDGVLPTLTVGPRERVLDCSSSLNRLLGRDAGELVDRSLSDFQQALGDRYGSMTAQETLSQSDDQIDVVATFGDQRFRSALVALRDDDGRLDAVRLLVVSLP